jgi:hypothetical protein
VKRFAALLSSASLLLMTLLTAPIAQAATGDLVGSVDFGGNCASGLGVGIAFDGSHLWYSCYGSATDLYEADPTTGAVIASYSIAGGLGALAYDAGRNAIWAGWGASSGDSGNVRLIRLDAAKNVVSSAIVFNAAAANGFSGLDDGLAFDGLTDELFISDDTYSTTIYHYSTSGALLDSFAWGGDSCYNSGLAIGGSLLYEGSDGCSHVWVVDKTTKAAAFNFSTGQVRDEDLECDNVTFAGAGKTVMWSMEAYDTNWNPSFGSRHALAFEIPAGSCTFGGGTTAALSPGYWKNHADATTSELPQSLDGYSVSTFAQATAVFTAMNCGKAKADAVGCLAGQLLAAKLNVSNGSPGCIGPTIASADTFLSSIPYTGPGASYTLNASQRSAALGLQVTLSGYNAGGGCP